MIVRRKDIEKGTEKRNKKNASRKTSTYKGTEIDKVWNFTGNIISVGNDDLEYWAWHWPGIGKTRVSHKSSL